MSGSSEETAAPPQDGRRTSENGSIVDKLSQTDDVEEVVEVVEDLQRDREKDRERLEEIREECFYEATVELVLLQAGLSESTCEDLLAAMRSRREQFRGENDE